MANGIKTIKYIQIVEAEDKLYLIYFSPKFYDLFDLFYKPEGSYYNILYRLFGLLPQDFYHMLAKEYHAIFQKRQLRGPDSHSINLAHAHVWCKAGSCC